MPKIQPLSAAEAARSAGIPKRTLIAAITRGELKAHKLPGVTGSYLIDPRDLEKYVTKREARASA